MAHIVFDLSSVEAKNRFREAVSDMLDLTDTVTESFLEKTKNKARTLELAAPDYHDILLQLLHERGGMGFSCATNEVGEPAMSCASCGVVTLEVSWLCTACGSPMIETYAMRLDKVNETDEIKKFVRERKGKLGHQEVLDFKAKLEKRFGKLPNIEFIELLERECREKEKNELERGRAISPTFICPITGIEFVFVKGGSFKMGKIAGLVEVSDFYISKYLVTVNQFEKFMADTKSETAGKSGYSDDHISRTYRTWNHPGYVQDGAYPVTCVSWDDSVLYADWLSMKLKKKVSLPTEEQWEFAARSRGKEDRWAGTNDELSLCEFAWYKDNSMRRLVKLFIFRNSEISPHPVGLKKPNDLGLYDICGNVWEWCMDWFDTDKRFRAIRGGSCLSGVEQLVTWKRNGDTPRPRNHFHIGFRVVLSNY